MVGDGPERRALEAERDRLGLAASVIIAGHRPNPVDEMNAADVVALSSRWEGSPLAVAECLSLGRPLVTTAVGTVTRHLTDGVDARVVPVGDQHVFGRALAGRVARSRCGSSNGSSGPARRNGDLRCRPSGGRRRGDLPRSGRARCYTNSMTTGEIEALVALVPSWQGRPTTLRPLHGGITNRNYVVTVDDREYVVRIPGERTELLGIDRANEAEAAERAAKLGIGPPVLGELPTVGTLITELVDGHHLDPDAFADRLADVVELLRRFHESGPVAGAFPIHRVVEWHARDATIHGVIPPSGYDRLHQHSRRIEAAFAAAPTPIVPCHNDLLPEQRAVRRRPRVVARLRVRGHERRLLRPRQPQRELRTVGHRRRRPVDRVLRSGHSVELGAAATDEGDERVPRRHVGRRAAGDQHAGHRLRRVRRRAAWAAANAWPPGPSLRRG